MQYRTMPGSDEKLSVLGFGCMRLPTKGRFVSSIDVQEAKKQILYAIDNGVNYLDTAYPYHKGESESFLGKYILKNGYREKVNIATKLPVFMINKKEKFDEIFSKQLAKLNVEYIDYYLLHAINGSTWEKMKSLGIIDWMKGIKNQGRVRKLGFSYHGAYEDFPGVVNDFDWDFTQIQYNILDENMQAGRAGIEYAHDKGLGVIVMEPLRGGSLAGKLPRQIEQIYERSGISRSPAQWALRWIYDNPAVTLLLSGMNDLEHIKQNIETASQAYPRCMTPDEKKIVEEVKEKYLELMAVGCTGCGYCLPCPAGINIPGAFKDLNNYHMFNKSSSKFFHIAFNGIMTKDGKPHLAVNCIECGECEKKCPQNIEIRKELKNVKKEMEGLPLRAMAAIARPFVNAGKKKRKTE